MKSGTCSGSTPYRSRTSAGPIRGNFTGADGLKNRGRSRSKLKSVAVSGRHYSRSASTLLVVNGRSQKIIGLVTWKFRGNEAACGNEFRQHIELVEQLGIKLTSSLIGRKCALAVVRCIERIPADHHSPRPLALVQSQQKVCEADDCAGTSIPAPPDQLGQAMIGAVCKRIAIYDKQPSTH
jgi:hypothetical protein